MPWCHQCANLTGSFHVRGRRSLAARQANATPAIGRPGRPLRAQTAILDTISRALFGPLQSLWHDAAAIMLLVSETLISFPMPSDSGKAMITLPLMIPLVPAASSSN